MNRPISKGQYYSLDFFPNRLTLDSLASQKESHLHSMKLEVEAVTGRGRI